MLEVAPILDRYESLLHGHVAQILDVALSSPPGGAARWDQVMGVFGLASTVPKHQRGAVAAQRRHNRGAFPEEVTQVLQCLAQDAHRTLGQIWAIHHAEIQSDPAVAARFQAIAAQVQNLVATQTQAYHQALRPPPQTGAGLGGIFANVRATAEINPWNSWKQERQITLQCPGCGAAQTAELVFTCKFCGNNLFGGGTDELETSGDD